MSQQLKGVRSLLCPSLPPTLRSVSALDWMALTCFGRVAMVQAEVPLSVSLLDKCLIAKPLIEAQIGTAKVPRCRRSTVSALREAVRWKLLLANQAEDVHLPRQARRRLIVLDVEQSRSGAPIELR